MEPLLRLLHLADSALPVGGMAHSFGLESLVELGFVGPDNLEPFLRDWIEETGLVESAFCAAGVRQPPLAEWLEMNARLGARKPARETREASAALGRRLIDLADGAFGIAAPAADGAELQYACCFGFVAGALDIPDEPAVAAFLHQSVAGLVSACQRLMPLGHTRAHAILFHLKPQMARIAGRALRAGLAAPSFTPLVEVASMNHPRLSTRLFIS